MSSMPKCPALKSVSFLEKVGEVLRRDSADVAVDDVPADMMRLLQQLAARESEPNQDDASPPSE